MGRSSLVLALVLAACSSSYAGADAPTNGDAGTTPPPPPSASDDAGADAPAGPVPCTHLFCDDFDRTTPATTGWGTFLLENGAATLTTETSRSAPSSLAISLSAPKAEAFLEQPLGTPAKTVAFAVDLDMATSATADEIDLAQLKWVPAPAPCTEYGFYLVRSAAGKLVLQETFADCNGGVKDDVLLDAAPGWHRYEVEATIGSVGHLVVRVDGQALIGKDLPTIPSSPVVLRVGAGSKVVTGPALAHYDNVTADSR